MPIKAYRDEYILQDPVHRGVQCGKIYAEHEVISLNVPHQFAKTPEIVIEFNTVIIYP